MPISNEIDVTIDETLTYVMVRMQSIAKAPIILLCRSFFRKISGVKVKQIGGIWVCEIVVKKPVSNRNSP